MRTYPFFSLYISVLLPLTDLAGHSPADGLLLDEKYTRECTTTTKHETLRESRWRCLETAAKVAKKHHSRQTPYKSFSRAPF